MSKTINYRVMACGLKARDVPVEQEYTDIEDEAHRLSAAYQVENLNVRFWVEKLVFDVTGTLVDVIALSPPAPGDGLNGAKTESRDNTTFIALPRHLWRACDGGCCCKYCSDRPRKYGVGFWDTLAVSPDSGHAWTVHRPDLHGVKPKRPT